MTSAAILAAKKPAGSRRSQRARRAPRFILRGRHMAVGNYFERYLLREVASPLTLGLDEVDLVFQHPEVAADFLGLLRGWHEFGKNKNLWKDLRLVIVHSTEVYIPLSMNQSPFNVGMCRRVKSFHPGSGLSWPSPARDTSPRKSGLIS